MYPALKAQLALRLTRKYFGLNKQLGSGLEIVTAMVRLFRPSGTTVPGGLMLHV